jgi:two-component system nitrogen regulation response regulator GlnG
VIKHSLLAARGHVLLPEFLPPLDKQPSTTIDADRDHYLTESDVEHRLRDGTENLYADVMGNIEYQLLSQVLRHTEGNQLKAAGMLGISRVTLRSKLRSLGIDASQFVKSR